MHRAYHFIRSVRAPWLRAVGALLILILPGTASRAAGADETSPRVAILTYPHPSYRAKAAAVRKQVEDKGYTPFLLELPKTPDRPSEQDEGGATQPGAETKDAPPRPTTQPAPEREFPPELIKARQAVLEIDPALVVTTGERATMFALDALPDVPVVFCMVPNALDMPFMRKDHRHRKRVAGVTTDVKPEDQVQLLLELHGNKRSVGVFHSPRTEKTAQAIADAAAGKGLTVKPIDANKDRFPLAIDALNDKSCESALMIADAAVYNAPNVQRLLLWGIRNKRPVWAFSDNVVKAGALAGVCAGGDELAGSTTKLVDRVLKGEDIAKIGLHYVPLERLQISLNERTADMIGLSVPRRFMERVSLRFGDTP